jgi:protoporphyrin/coproporphyrin ferrochelatase
LQQSDALEEKLKSLTKNEDYKCFVFMRYWHPFAKEVVEQVKSYQPDEIILLPLYPQYSITTTGTGLIEWNKYAKKASLSTPYKVIVDYPDSPFFIDTIADLIRETLKSIKHKSEYRMLLSAHGLPIESGDRYQTHVERTCSALMENLKAENIDYVICYQSRVGPLEWIGPSTDDEIIRAGADNKNIIMVPVAFVSEHSETLVELDIEYKELANENNIKEYIRIGTVGNRKKFIAGLAELVIDIKGK